MNVIAIIKLLISLLPTIVDAIHAAEAAFGPSKGTEKLAHAVDAVQQVLPAGTAWITKSGVDAVLPTVISAAVGLMNKKGELPKAAAPAAQIIAAPPSSG